MNILIAEDEFISRNLLQKVLEMMGHEVLVAEDGLLAWELFQKNDVKIIVTDWIMPRMNGLELCKKIRSAGKENYTYIIVLTAMDQKDDLVQVFNSGADDYISKPFDHEELKARIKTGERVIQLEEEHKRINDILIESRNKLKIVFDSMHEKIISLDEKLNIVSANKTCLESIEYNFSNIIGKSFFDDENGFNILSYNKEIKLLVMKVFNSGKPQSHLDKSADKHGKIRYEQVNILPIKNDAGKIFQTVIVAKDITEDRRKTEKIETLNKEIKATSEQIRAKNERLEQALKELKNTQAQILQSEKMASIGQLAAGVAHEINNPTGFVSSNLKTLMDYQNDLNQLIKEYRKLTTNLKDSISDNNLSPAISEQIEKIATLETEVDIDFVQEDIQDLIQDCREGTERIKKIVIDLKDFAHPGEDKLQVADINNGMESTLNVVSNELKYKATVTKDFGVLPGVKCYPQQLNQVFMNILVNAVQAIEKQGEINIKTRHVNGYVEIAISDTGSGISEENLNKIFDPFFTTKDVGKGTGLGMNIAYNIIKKHNGTIDVESTVGEGTTFMIRIPAE
ncbi:MAG: response regulator [Deltaproteobacteria bacterium]|nr:response regulator [Deltaproteobacteria bacterium]